MHPNKQVTIPSPRIMPSCYVHIWIYIIGMWYFMDEATFLSQFQFGLHNDMKDLLLTMLDPTTLNQVIAQVIWCNNYFFECCII